jgi:multicomponent Na+:H+ antiporter subunit F
MRRLAAAPAFALGTLADMVRGTWHVALYIVGVRRLDTPGLVAIPRGERTSSGVAVWGYITAISPDEIVVEADDDRGLLLVHLLDARDIPAIHARHARTYERRQPRVFPKLTMRPVIVGVALTWMTLLLVAGGLLLLRSRDMLQRIIVSDLLAAIVIALLALLSYLRQTSYYLDAALALALLSFVSTLAAARHYAEGGPF